MNIVTINSFKISVSIANYTNKNKIDWKTIKYRQEELGLDEFVNLIKHGYCFCHCFKTVNSIFGLREKTDKNFMRADMVFVDIDDSDIEMMEFVGHLSKVPTVYYTTPNNYSEKSGFKYRFRLCYLFNTPITTVDRYKTLYKNILNNICNDIVGFANKDNCGASPSQQFSGNAKSNCKLQITSNVFSYNDFPFQNNNASLSSSLLISNGKQVQESSYTIKDIEITDNEFMDDIGKLKPMELIRKYRNRYHYFTRTELEFNNGFALIPNDYQEIYRSWKKSCFTKSNGDTISIQAVKKLRDGDGRKKKLYIAGLIMKKIQPSITYEHLLYNLLCEREYYHDNSDGELNIARMKDIARNIINKPLAEISLNSKEKRKFVVDKSYCAEHGITANQMKNIVRKQLKDEEIGRLYDCSMTLAENLETLKSMNVRVGKSRLYEWCKRYGISPKGTSKTIKLHNTQKKMQLFMQQYFFTTCQQEKSRIAKDIENTMQIIVNSMNVA